MNDGDLELREYFWRAAAICRRHGLKQSAVVIADNIDALTQAIVARPDVRATPSTSVLTFPSHDPLAGRH